MKNTLTQTEILIPNSTPKNSFKNVSQSRTAFGMV